MERRYFCMARIVLAAQMVGLMTGCVVNSRCYNDADCCNDKICDNSKCVPPCHSDGDCKVDEICIEASGLCRDPQCYPGKIECPNGFDCVDKICVAQGRVRCPSDDMVLIEVEKEHTFCIDVYEASRPDATESSPGEDVSKATSRSGVLPWLVSSNEEADSACKAAGKRLCDEDSEWPIACQGPDNTVYSYGDDYIADICNGIDLFCDCEACGIEVDECPYPHCFDDCRYTYTFKLLPTASLPDCTNEYGIYDINGNVWEHVLGGDETRVRGGAFNCGDSEKLHRCDYIPNNWVPDALGFRCCADGVVELDTDSETEDGGVGGVGEEL